MDNTNHMIQDLPFLRSSSDWSPYTSLGAPVTNMRVAFTSQVQQCIWKQPYQRWLEDQLEDLVIFSSLLLLNRRLSPTLDQISTAHNKEGVPSLYITCFSAVVPTGEKFSLMHELNLPSHNCSCCTSLYHSEEEFGSLIFITPIQIFGLVLLSTKTLGWLASPAGWT